VSDSSTKHILEGSLAWGVARFGTPLALGMAFQTTFNLVDAYLVSRLPAAEVQPALGALGICDQFGALGTIISYGISTASGSLMARQKGAGDEDAVRKTAWQSLLLVAALGLVFALIGVTLSGPIVRNIIGAKGAVAVLAVPYLRVVVAGSFSMFFVLQLTSMQRALGSAKTPMALLAAGNVLNIGLAIVMMFGDGPAPAAFAWGAPVARALHIPAMGLQGAAWATVIARTLVLIPNVVVMIRRFAIARPPPGGAHADAKILRSILDLAWPSSMQFVLRIGAFLFVNSLVARAYTTATDQTATTALGLVFRLDTMALFIGMGWGSAAQTFVGQNLGAHHDDRAMKSGWIATLYDGVTNLGLWAMFLFAGVAILHVFDDDPAPVGIALEYLHVVAPSYLGLGVAVVLSNAMTGAGATRISLWLDGAVILGFQVPVCAVVVWVMHAGYVDLFRCVAATNVVGAIAYAVVYGRGMWRDAGRGSRPEWRAAR
jgi:putative MATE family efflux protein